jgi:hypothetical protein
MRQLSSGLLNQVQHNDGSTAVAPPNPCDLRAQAEVYFELARHMSLDADAEVFRATAQECLARATRLEADAAEPAVPAPAA